MGPSRTPRNAGFDGRLFLDETEWLTYRRRKPVRYIRRTQESVCRVCGLPGSNDNPLQSSHIIGFDLGVIELGMTPEFLDSSQNIVTAHRRICNKKSELDLQAAMTRLREIGINELPHYLPDSTRAAWQLLTEPNLNPIAKAGSDVGTDADE